MLTAIFVHSCAFASLLSSLFGLFSSIRLATIFGSSFRFRSGCWLSLWFALALALALMRAHFVLTLARRGDLLSYVTRLSSLDERCTRFYAAEIVLALEYLHSIGVIHRCVLPVSCLVSSHHLSSCFRLRLCLRPASASAPTCFPAPAPGRYVVT